MKRINHVRYLHYSFSQKLKWLNTTDYIISGAFFYPLDMWVQIYGLYVNWEVEVLKYRSHCIENFGRVGGCCFVMCMFWKLCGCFGNTGRADRSLARPGKKRARKNIRDVRYFSNIEPRADIKFFPARQGAEGNSHDSDRNISLFNFLYCFFCICLF